MDDHDDGLARLLVQAADQLHRLVAGADVEVGGGLVEHDEVGVLRQRHGDERSLALAARQPPQLLRPEPRDARKLEGALHVLAILARELPLMRLVRIAPACYERLHRHRRRAAGLGQHGHATGARLRLERQRGHPADAHLPRLRPQQAVDEFDHRGLPAAVRADDAGHRPMRKHRGKPPDERFLAVGERHLAKLDGRNTGLRDLCGRGAEGREVRREFPRGDLLRGAATSRTAQRAVRASRTV